MIVTDSGMIMDVRSVKAKVPAPMVVTEEPRVTEVSGHSSKAPSPMVVIIIIYDNK
jgi:hypothetical protein